MLFGEAEAAHSLRTRVEFGGDGTLDCVDGCLGDMEDAAERVAENQAQEEVHSVQDGQETTDVTDVASPRDKASKDHGDNAETPRRRKKRKEGSKKKRGERVSEGGGGDEPLDTDTEGVDLQGNCGDAKKTRNKPTKAKELAGGTREEGLDQEKKRKSTRPKESDSVAEADAPGSEKKAKKAKRSKSDAPSGGSETAEETATEEGKKAKTKRKKGRTEKDGGCEQEPALNARGADVEKGSQEGGGQEKEKGEEKAKVKENADVEKEKKRGEKEKKKGEKEKAKGEKVKTKGEKEKTKGEKEKTKGEKEKNKAERENAKEDKSKTKGEKEKAKAENGKGGKSKARGDKEMREKAANGGEQPAGVIEDWKEENPLSADGEEEDEVSKKEEKRSAKEQKAKAKEAKAKAKEERAKVRGEEKARVQEERAREKEEAKSREPKAKKESKKTRAQAIEDQAARAASLMGGVMAMEQEPAQADGDDDLHETDEGDRSRKGTKGSMSRLFRRLSLTHSDPTDNRPRKSSSPRKSALSPHSRGENTTAAPSAVNAGEGPMSDAHEGGANGAKGSTRGLFRRLSLTHVDPSPPRAQSTGQIARARSRAQEPPRRSSSGNVKRSGLVEALSPRGRSSAQAVPVAADGSPLQQHSEQQKLVEMARARARERDPKSRLSLKRAFSSGSIKKRRSSSQHRAPAAQSSLSAEIEFRDRLYKTMEGIRQWVVEPGLHESWQEDIDKARKDRAQLDALYARSYHRQSAWTNSKARIARPSRGSAPTRGLRLGSARKATTRSTVRTTALKHMHYGFSICKEFEKSASNASTEKAATGALIASLDEVGASVRNIDASSMLSFAVDAAAEWLTTLEELNNSLERNLAKKTEARLKHAVDQHSPTIRLVEAEKGIEDVKDESVFAAGSSSSSLLLLQAVEGYLSTLVAYFKVGRQNLNGIVDDLLECRSLISLEEDVDRKRTLLLPTTLPEPVNIVKQGSLNVEGSVASGSLWVVVSPSLLQWFKLDNDGRPSECVGHLYLCNLAVDGGEGRTSTFKIEGNGVKWVCTAADPLQQRSWCQAIDTCIVERGDATDADVVREHISLIDVHSIEACVVNSKGEEDVQADLECERLILQEKSQTLPPSVDAFISQGQYSKSWRDFRSRTSEMIEWISQPVILAHLIRYIFMVGDALGPEARAAEELSSMACDILTADSAIVQAFFQDAHAGMLLQQLFSFLELPAPLHRHQTNLFCKLVEYMLEAHPEAVFLFLTEEYAGIESLLLNHVENERLLRFIVALPSYDPCEPQRALLHRIGIAAITRLLAASYSLLGEEIENLAVVLKLLVRKRSLLRLNEPAPVPSQDLLDGGDSEEVNTRRRSSVGVSASRRRVSTASSLSSVRRRGRDVAEAAAPVVTGDGVSNEPFFAFMAGEKAMTALVRKSLSTSDAPSAIVCIRVLEVLLRADAEPDPNEQGDEEDAPEQEMAVVVENTNTSLGPMWHAVLKRLPKLAHLVNEDGVNGRLRYEAVGVVLALLKKRHSLVDEALATADGPLSGVVRLVVEHASNSLLQTRLLEVVESCFSVSTLRPILKTCLLRQCGIAEALMTAISSECKEKVEARAVLVEMVTLVATEGGEAPEGWEEFVKALEKEREEESATFVLEDAFVDEDRTELWSKTMEKFAFLISE